MRVDIFDSDDERVARHREAYRRQRDMLASATNAHLMDLLGTDDDLRRTAARDELLRRGEQVST
jgi:hypothetical protein